MRILILGGDGMLGHQMFDDLRGTHQVAVTVRNDLTFYDHYRYFQPETTYANIDVRQPNSLDTVFANFQPQVVVNAIGIVKQRDIANDIIPSLEINALFPHRLAIWCKMINARLIHFSTDCVFSGVGGNYREDSPSDATDLYGKTKFLGEVKSAGCLTIRTSIIGLELSRNKSLIEWFLAQTGRIKGYRQAIYTGLTTREIARVTNRLIAEFPNLSGVWHVASDPINKHDLLTNLSGKLGRADVTIEADDSFRCDRSLNGSRFTGATGYVPPSWDSMLAELAGQIKLRDHIT